MTPRRVLMIVSDDYGELSNAVCLALGSRFSTQLLLTEKLLALNPDVLPAPAQAYCDVGDVIRVAQDSRPDAAFLLSGYLYAAHGVLRPEDTQTLVAELGALGIVVATSDPFLGMMSDMRNLPLDAQKQQRTLLAALGAAGQTLQDVWHLYPVAPDGQRPRRRAAFFNPRMLVSDGDRTTMRNGLALHLPLDLDRPRWLFALAAEDYAVQLQLMGERFHELLVERLEDAHRQQRQPVLIAPEACAEALRARVERFPSVLLLSFCNHGTFLGLLLEAEHAFYWNVFANSVPSRLSNRLPVCFFDTGHMARTLPQLLNTGLSTYYPGARLPLLDLAMPLVDAALAELARSEIDSLALAHARLCAGATPDALLERILADR